MLSEKIHLVKNPMIFLSEMSKVKQNQIACPVTKGKCRPESSCIMTKISMEQNAGDHMRRKQLAGLVFGAVLTVIFSILLVACDSGGCLHADLAALAKGDYSHVADPDVAEMVRSAIDRGAANWTSGDINGDGEPELILLDTTGRPSRRPQPMMGVFYVHKGKIENAVLDFNDSTEYFFLGPDGNAVYFYSTSGAILTEQYYPCTFTDAYDYAYTAGLVIANFLDGTDLNGEPLDRGTWAKEHPELADMTLEGVHYIRLSSESGQDRLIEEEIDKQRFLAEYKVLTGLDFSDEYEQYSR